MISKQLGKANLWTVYQQRNKWFDKLEKKMRESGFSWWQLMALTSQSGVAPKHEEEQPAKVLIPTACQNLCSNRKNTGAKETAIEAVYFHSQGLLSV